jgi:hypothetical protein
MKKNNPDCKNILTVKTIKIEIRQFKTDAPTSDLAYDDYVNQSLVRGRLIQSWYEAPEIQDFIINKPKERNEPKSNK